MHGSRKKPDKRIDHHISDSVDLVCCILRLKVGVSVFRRSEQEIGKPVGDDPVDFLRHGSIERTESSFDVRHLN